MSARATPDTAGHRRMAEAPGFDGTPRRLQDGTPVLVDGRLSGRVLRLLPGGQAIVRFGADTAVVEHGRLTAAP